LIVNNNFKVIFTISIFSLFIINCKNEFVKLSFIIIFNWNKNKWVIIVFALNHKARKIALNDQQVNRTNPIEERLQIQQIRKVIPQQMQVHTIRANL